MSYGGYYKSEPKEESIPKRRNITLLLSEFATRSLIAEIKRRKKIKKGK